MASNGTQGHSGQIPHVEADRKIDIGFLLIPYQALDAIGPMDIIQNISAEMITLMGSAEKAKTLDAPTVAFHHIAPNMEPVLTTGNLRVSPTTTYKDCPDLDYLLIGGPNPEFVNTMPQETKDFMIEQSKKAKAILTTCTGGLVLAATGLLDGLPATTNHVCQHGLGEAYGPKVKWDWKSHWVIAQGPHKAKFWTAAGAGAGMDMMAQFIREESKHGQDLLDMSTMALEWAPRDVNGKIQKHMNGNGVVA